MTSIKILEDYEAAFKEGFELAVKEARTSRRTVGYGQDEHDESCIDWNEARRAAREHLFKNRASFLEKIVRGHEGHDEYNPRLTGEAAEAARRDPGRPEGACCNNERRGMNGGCANCGAPCL